MNIVIRLLPVCLSVLLLAGCLADSEADKSTVNQLNAIHEQLKTLTVEVVRLQEQVADFKKTDAEEPEAKEIDFGLSSTLTRMGNADAQYAIVEFMDYQCPYCIRHAKSTLPLLKKNYIETGLVQYFVKDFPLDFHAEAENAAIAARCAANQGKFEVMHGLLLESSRQLSSSLYSELAAKADLNQKKFSECFSDKSNLLALNENIKQARRAGVAGTPRFFIGKINGDSLVNIVSISGAQSVESFEQALQWVFSRQ